MDRHTELGSVDSSGPESGVSATDETLRGNLGTEERIEGSSDEDGGEIMVEVVGSDVIFDGFVSHGDSHTHLEEGGDREIGTFDVGSRGLEDGERLAGGDGGIVTETEVFQHGDAGCSDQEAQNVVGKVGEVIRQSVREETIAVEETVVNEVFQSSDGVCSIPGAETVVGVVDEVVVRSMTEQTEVVAEEIVRRSNEESFVRVAEDFLSTDVVIDQESRDGVGEAGDVVMQCTSEHTEVFEKEIVQRPSEEGVVRLLVEEGGHVGSKSVNRVSGGLDCEAWNPGIETTVGDLPLREEYSGVQNQIVSEDITTADEGEGPHHVDGAPDVNVMEVELPYSEKNRTSEAEVVSLGTDKGGSGQANTDAADKQAEASSQEEREVMYKEGILHLEVGRSSVTEESSSVQNQAVSEEVTMAVQGEDPHQEDGAPDGNVMELEKHYSEDYQSSKAEVVYVRTDKNGNGRADAEDAHHQQPEASIKENCTAERGNVAGMDVKQKLDLKHEAPGHDTLGDTENYMGEEHSLEVKRVKESSENDVTLEAITDCESLLPSYPDTSVGRTLVAKREIVELDVKKDPGSRVEISDGDACYHNDENFDAQTVSENTEMQAVASVNFESSGPQTETESQLESMGPRWQATIEAKGHAETDGRIAVQDAVVGDDENHLSATAVEVNSDLAETMTIEMNLEMVAQLVQSDGTLIYEMDHDELTVDVDEVSDNETSVACLSDTVINITDTSQAPVDTASIDGESGHVSSCVSDFASPLSDSCQCLDVHEVQSDVSMLHGNQTRDIHVSDEVISSEGINRATETKEEPCGIDETCTADAYVQEFDVSSLKVMEVDDRFTDGAHTELTTEADQLDMSTDMAFIPEKSEVVDRSGYLLPSESEGEFSASDLVWGKVRSHPWWPGQIFDPADASEKAIKYHKRDCFLVAYFGDRTFAWNDASLLKPFWSHFSQIEKQVNSEAFHNAVSCALREVSRRFELGLACSCISEDDYDKIECQIVESTGIHEESSRRYGVDKSTEASSFQPDKLLEYIRSLAQSPSSGVDRLEVVIAKAQLLSFFRFKGFSQLPEFRDCERLAENDTYTSDVSETVVHPIPEAEEKLTSDDDSSHNQKHNFKDNSYSKKKEKSLVELMVDAPYSPEEEDGSAKRRKAVDSCTDGSDRRLSFYAAKVSNTASTSPKPSFKVGECIRRVASQLTGSPSIAKNNSDHDVSLQMPESLQRGMVPTEYSSLDQMLSQLYVAARGPMKGYSFLKTIIEFFSGFRNSIILSQHPVRQNSSAGKPGSGRKRKPSHVISSEEFEFDDVNDSYWTDRIIQNYSEEQLLQNSENVDAEHSVVAFEPDKSLKSSRRSYSRKRYSSGNHEMVAEELTNHVDDKMLDLSPVELILNFAEGDSVPSELNLNKIFRRFGPLKESDTEIDSLSSRARVVFKRGSDAKIALSSAGKFNIFGSKLVNYELNYSPTSFKYVPLMILEGQEDAI